MSQEAVEKVLGRMLTDDDFRQRAADNLIRACWEEGYPLSETELRNIVKVEMERMSFASEKVDGSIKRPASFGSTLLRKRQIGLE